MLYAAASYLHKRWKINLFHKNSDYTVSDFHKNRGFNPAQFHKNNDSGIEIQHRRLLPAVLAIHAGEAFDGPERGGIDVGLRAAVAQARHRAQDHAVGALADDARMRARGRGKSGEKKPGGEKPPGEREERRRVQLWGPGRTSPVILTSGGTPNR
ncbi:hypothetical protein [Bifidobacterium parmae]|uniref:hypothetical protein n=1 Tax=Bifidobacterium parmae TaxID=361854 RepID=UPI0013FD5C34|nr:hypothetical protein [Bifidobacterium parmae]